MGPARPQLTAAVAMLCAGAVLAYVYTVWYPRTGDVAPDSVYGYGFAIAGTGLLLATGLGYTVRKRWRHHWAGRMHTLLAWHMAGALLGLVLILMHAAGNFNARSGTFALYGLLGLIVSGMIGQALDRVCPWLEGRAAMQGAMRREQLYLQLMHTWRHVHILLSLVFLGLLVWHLIYAATLLMHGW
jgi:hypothetical protein